MIEIKGLEEAVHGIVLRFSSAAVELRAPHVVYRPVCKEELGKGWVARSPQFPTILGSGINPESAMRAFDKAVFHGQSFYFTRPGEDMWGGCEFFPEAKCP